MIARLAANTVATPTVASAQKRAIRIKSPVIGLFANTTLKKIKQNIFYLF